MKDMSLSQLLRFAMAGGVYLVALIVQYLEVRQLTLAQGSGATAGLALAGSLVVGSIVYSVHRAVMFPAIRRLVFLVLGEKRHAIDIDMERWDLQRRLLPDRSLQAKLLIWADQIHFMYCAVWALLLSSLTGLVLGWSGDARTLAVLIVTAVLGLATIVYNVRYGRYELRVLAADRVEAAS